METKTKRYKHARGEAVRLSLCRLQYKLDIDETVQLIAAQVLSHPPEFGRDFIALLLSSEFTKNAAQQ